MKPAGHPGLGPDRRVAGAEGAGDVVAARSIVDPVLDLHPSRAAASPIAAFFTPRRRADGCSSKAATRRRRGQEQTFGRLFQGGRGRSRPTSCSRPTDRRRRLTPFESGGDLPGWALRSRRAGPFPSTSRARSAVEHRRRLPLGPRRSSSGVAALAYSGAVRGSQLACGRHSHVRA